MSSLSVARVSRQRFLLAGAAAYASIGLVPAPTRAAQFEFKCASNMPNDHPASIRLNQMWAAIGQESGGRIHCQFFPNSELGGDAAMLSQLRLGALQFFLVSSANLASLVPGADICFLGFAFKDEDEGLRVMDGPLGAYVRQGISAKNLFALRTFWDAGMYQIGSSSVIRSPDDLRGFKIRVSETKLLIDLFRAFGASPTPTNFSETYTALQTKLLDGVAAPLVNMETSRFYEVQKYITMTNHSWSGQWLIANGDVWKTLPPDLQAIVERNNTKHAGFERRDTKAKNAVLADRLAQKGNVINEIDQGAFRTHLRPYYEEWAKTFGPTAWELLQTSLGRKLT